MSTFVPIGPGGPRFNPVGSPAATPGVGPGAATGKSGALAGFGLPEWASDPAVQAFAKPVLKGALGIDLDALEGQSPLALLAELVSKTKTQEAQGKRDIINSAVGASSSANRMLREASENIDVDVAGAVVKWATNPDNLQDGLKFGAKVVETVVAAVASGGTSLIKDLPALGGAALVLANDILLESGLSLDQVIGSAVTDVLVELGMKPEDARKLGPFIGSAAVAGAQVYSALESGNLSCLDPKVFANLAKNGAVLMGTSERTADVLGTGVGGGLTLAQTFMGGNSQLFSSGNLEGLMSSGAMIGEELSGLVSGRGMDLDTVMKELVNFGTLLDGVLGDLEKDTGVPGLQIAISDRATQYLNDLFDGLGPFKPVISAGADFLQQQAFGNQRSMI